MVYAAIVAVRGHSILVSAVDAVLETLPRVRCSLAFLGPAVHKPGRIVDLLVRDLFDRLCYCWFGRLVFCLAIASNVLRVGFNLLGSTRSRLERQCLYGGIQLTLFEQKLVFKG